MRQERYRGRLQKISRQSHGNLASSERFELFRRHDEQPLRGRKLASDRQWRRALLFESIRVGLGDDECTCRVDQDSP